ncbi:helix-turn-helix transcriptional regulator [Streptomyces sp. RKAG293]|uniref:helix-turn-helix transcriptional regulator n=1 Tax=Streptomyces sp. RKAG293 TaxID=2893403 RepID=UPI00203399ED|nr:helix-turn-helix transcriptional regulator [Streptomyces sp. RKAG293]MCM2416574.1 helix-turn-helix transcriptional regulator [Streptomyces sp. RKAG293]
MGAHTAASTVPLGAIAHLIPAGLDLSDPVKAFPLVAAALVGPQGDRKWAVLVDDLHLLDTASAVLLHQLLKTRAIRLIGTVRTGEPTNEAVDALCRADGVHRLQVEAMNRQQVAAALEAALGGRVGRRTIHELHAASGGNVLYLRELVIGALAAGTLGTDGAIWELAARGPEGTPKLAELINARLADADPEGWPVLELLALCGSLSLTDAQAVAPPDALSSLESSGLIQVLTDSRRTVLHFLHPLYGEAVRAELPTLRRRTLLLRQAERVQAYGARRREDILNLATWHLAATGNADPGLLIQAATLARHVRDHAHVVSLLRALEDRDHTAMTLLMLGESLFVLGDAQDAEEILGRAAAAASDDFEKVEITFIRSQNLFWALNDTAASMAVNSATHERLTDAEARRTLRINEGIMLTMLGHPLKALPLMGDLNTESGGTPKFRISLIAAMMRPAALAIAGRTQEAIAASEEAYAVHGRIGDRMSAAAPVGHLISLMLALMEAGQLKRARETGQQAWDMYGHHRNPLTLIWLAYHQGRADWLAGHVESAHRWFAEAAAAARTYRIHRGIRLALSGLAACAVLTSDLAMAESIEREAAAYPLSEFRSGEQRLGEAWLHVSRGHLGEARRVLTEAATMSRESGDNTSEAMLLTDIARLGGAEQVVDRLSELAQLCDGDFMPVRARLASSLASNDPVSLLAVSNELDAVGADLLAAEAAAAAAAAWLRIGHAHQAALATAQSQACEARCGGSNTPLLAFAHATVSLTNREREIALFAATGTTSREIANILQLSVRTVDNHLQSVYRRLGITSRRQLAEALDKRSTASA